MKTDKDRFEKIAAWRKHHGEVYYWTYNITSLLIVFSVIYLWGGVLIFGQGLKTPVTEIVLVVFLLSMIINILLMIGGDISDVVKRGRRKHGKKWN